MMELRVTTGKPEDPEAWDRLAQLNGNLLQSTAYDTVQAFYRQIPVYLHFFVDGQLAAGVKLYRWESTRIPILLPMLSRMFSQFGEYLVEPSLWNETLRTEINAAIGRYIRAQGTVQYKAGGFYGQSGKLADAFHKKTAQNLFQVAYLKLEKTEEELLAGFNTKHRNSLRKAQKSGLTFERDVPVEVLLDLLAQTYSAQDKSAPHADYIKHIYQTLFPLGLCRVYAVKKDDEYFSAALVQHIGNTADYTFGGNKRNDFGAGQFLQWEVMLDLKKQGIVHYSLGQVASEKQDDNLKFTQGISDFKRKFGTLDQESESFTVIIKPFRHRIFQLLVNTIN